MKKISAKQLYEAMDGIGDDLLLRSEQQVPARTGGKRRRTARRVLFAVTALAAVAVLGIASLSLLRTGKGDASLSEPAMAEYEYQAAGSASQETAALAESDAVKEPALFAQSSAKDGQKDAAMEEKAETESVAEEGATAFFFHDGKQYIQVAVIADGRGMAGAYVTTITTDVSGMEGIFTDGAGSVTGDVYLVNGRDEADALCMTGPEDGSLRIFEAVER